MNRFILAIAALSLLILPAAPSMADGPLRLAPCDTTQPVLTLAGDAYTATMPLLAGDDVRTFVLDLSGQTVAADKDMDPNAKVSASSSWDVLVNDYDLGVDGNLSENYQPIDSAEEFAQSGNITHCGTVSVSVINFLATGGDDVNVSVFVQL